MRNRDIIQKQDVNDLYLLIIDSLELIIVQHGLAARHPYELKFFFHLQLSVLLLDSLTFLNY
ncbi:hypothetical protein SACN08_03560 [Staphylococcus aureus]